MPFVIVTPIELEWTSLANAFKDLGLQGRERDVGRLKGLAYRDGELLLVPGGVGKAQFGVQTQHVLDVVPSVEAVVCAGVAGALVDTLGVGDVVVATSTVEHDFEVGFNPDSLPAFPGYTAYLSALRGLDLPRSASFTVRFGPVASGDEDIAEAARAFALHEGTGALAAAWEGAGGARAAAFSGVPYLEVRGISDSADEEAASTWEENVPTAMGNVALVLDEFPKRRRKSP